MTKDYQTKALFLCSEIFIKVILIKYYMRQFRSAATSVNLVWWADFGPLRNIEIINRIYIYFNGIIFPT